VRLTDGPGHANALAHEALIAPDALLDDERLDLVIVPPLPPAVLFANVWRLFSGALARWPAVETRQVRAATILASPPAPLQVDGEPVGGLDAIEIRVIPAARRVRAPRSR
jgi:diacylglycerol kinase family enzyme